ncbi:unnamed protein product [Thelazia callipaeda]|uniref:Receptor protein-tyrosine kinase n=1 Tax=Thelazia callipaeda TaxID=103827 RepID=A0A0N5DA89_THECL|nr:unnamed protein product [Thelazia callipaeda]
MYFRDCQNFPMQILSYYLILLIGTAKATIFSDSWEACQNECLDRNLVVALARGAVDWEPSLLSTDLTQRISACHNGCQDLESPKSTCLERCSRVPLSDVCMQGCRAVTDIFLHRLQVLLNGARVTIEEESVVGVSTVWNLHTEHGSVMNDIFLHDVQWAVQSRPANLSFPWNITIFNEKSFNLDTMRAAVIVPLVFSEEIEVLFLKYNVVFPTKVTIIYSFHLNYNFLRLCVFWRTYITVSPTYRLPVNDTDDTVPLAPVIVSQLQISKNSFVVCWKSALRRLYKISLYSLDGREMLTALKENNCYLFQELNSDNCCRAEIGFANITALTATVSVRIDLMNSERNLPSRNQLIITNGTSLMKLYDVNDYAVLTDPKIIPFKLKPGRSITALCSLSAKRLLIALDDGSIYWLSMDDESVSSGLLRTPDGTAIVHMDVDHLQDTVYAVLFKKGILRHIYCILNGGEVFMLPLFPLNAPQILPFSVTEKLPYLAFALEAEPENSRLILLTKTGSILAVNVIDQSVIDLRENVNVNGHYQNIKKAHSLTDRLFWISTNCGDTHLWDACLYSEEYDIAQNEIQLNRYLYASRVVDFIFLHDTQGEWRRLLYECRIIGSDGDESKTIELKDLNETDVIIPVLPGYEYHASVRACISTICSPYANAINTAFAPFTETLVIAFNGTKDAINYYDILGNPTENFTLPDSVLKQESSVFAYDVLLNSLYIAKTNKSSVIRIREDGTHQHFLSTLTAKFITIMPSKALIIVASDYLIVAYRLTSSFDQEIYSCESFSECGEVVGVAGDDETGDVFYLIRYLNGSTSLFTLNQDIRTPYFISSSENFPVLRQLIIVREKLVFITEEGEVGVCDKKLGSMNINLMLKNVLLAPISHLEHVKPISFVRNLTADDSSGRNTLTWSTESTFGKGKIIFKITLYKEKRGADRNVDYSLSENYRISETLLHQWPSRQKYDAEVEAFTAWDMAWINESGLIAPTKPPAPPTNLTIYATQQKTVDGARALMDLFWDEPTEWNGDALGYLINCTIDGMKEPVAEVPSTTRFYSFSVKSGSVSCAVAAHNEPTLEAYSDVVTIDSSEIRPFVRLFAINSNNNVISISNWLPTTQLQARAKRQSSSAPAISEQSLAFIGNDLYSIRKDSDSTQTYLFHIDPNNVENIIHKISIGGDIGKVDAMTSDWVANRLIFVSSAHVMQLPLNALQSLSVINPRRIMNLSSGAGDAKQLLFDPFSSTAFLLTKNGSLLSLNLNTGIEENMALRFECLKSETVSWMTADFAWNLASLPAIYVLTWNGMMRVDLTSLKCEEIEFAWEKFGEKGLKSILSFAIADKLYIFATSSVLIVYELGSATATPIAINGSPLKQILVATQSSQPFPERSCFALPPASEIKFTVRNEERSGALVSINEPKSLDICPGVSLPATQYEIHFQRKGSDKIRNIHSISNVLHIENGVLDKETDYEVSVSWFNQYTQISEASATQMLRTGYGFPSPPQYPTLFALTPDIVLLYWKLPEKPNAPIPEIKYIISQTSSTQSLPSAIAAQQFEGTHYASIATDVVSCLSDPCSAKISNLRPSTDYKFWVRAIHVSHLNRQFPDDAEGNSVEASVRTKDVAGTLRPENITGSSVVLRWNSLDPESKPKYVSFQYRMVGENALWKSPLNATFEGSIKSVAIVVRALHSATTYDYRFAAKYVNTHHYANHTFSYNETFFHVSQQFRTKPGTPLAPSHIRLVQEYDEWIVRWDKPLNDGGSSVTSYALEFRPNKDAEWEIAERGLAGDCLWWKPSRINFSPELAEFRVRAANSEGFGAYAYSKVHVYYQRNDRKRCKVRPQEISLHGYTSSFNRNTLPSRVINDLKTIPRVPKNSVSLSRTIGKGGFGEVYEGVACGLPQSPAKAVRVAVKVMSFVKSGGKPEKPQYCPDEIFAIVERAWIYHSEERPSFAELMPELEALRGCPAYQEDAPYPPTSSSGRTDSNFELSFNSNLSKAESIRSGSIRFDKSDNPSTKKQGRPSILRSLRKDRPKPPLRL